MNLLLSPRKMFRHLPSTSQLRAFEASARYLSFTHAADELNLTQSAISHQIGSLENFLNQKLFLRRNRTLVITPAGKKLQETVQKILPQLQRAVISLRAGGDDNKITISTLPSIASTWLVQKLTRLRDEFPEIDFSVLASETPDNFSTDVPIDFAVHFTHHDNNVGVQRHMMDEFYLPICAPSLLENPDLPLSSVEDLRYHTLIHQNETLGWDGWFAYHQINNVTPKRLLSFNHGDLAIQAAINGQGVALARSLMVERALEQRLLVSPLKMPLPTRRKYYIVAPRETAHGKTVHGKIVSQVMDWLCNEARRDKHVKI